MYAQKSDYEALYGEITEKAFNQLSLEADRLMDIATTGVDNVKKLRVAYPTADSQIIVACACKLINVLKQIMDAESSAASARGYTAGANGYQGKAVASVSAGNESVSFTSGSDATVIDKAIADINGRKKLFNNIITGWLSGVEDANGVNLLYMGKYPVEVGNV